MKLTPGIREGLNKGYESERENWGDDYVDQLKANLASVPDGTEIPFDDDIEEATATGAAMISLGIDYFFGGPQGLARE